MPAYDELERVQHHTGYPIAPIPFTAVTLEDRFWLPRLERNRIITIPDVFKKCEETGRLDNFRKAAGDMPGAYVGTMPFEDTDVYKAVEGASYTLSQFYDADLDAYLDSVVATIARAQEKDGYLYTNRSIDPAHVHAFAGPERWSNLVMSHELYNCGHLYEAACAHFEATGKRNLLEVAIRNADLICATFGPDTRHDVPGHQIIEMGLARLYRITGKQEYLRTARFFLDQRGRHETRKPYSYEDNPGYSQDHIPVLDQTEAVGHAVRALYMYSGMSDTAALLQDDAYAMTAERIWWDVVETKIYLDGGLGSRHRGEAFGDAYELPNATAYAETCAAIASVMWNHRLFLMFGYAGHYDVLEQTLYNALIAGISLQGNEYFYVNPLESDGMFPFNHGSCVRQPWFDVSCCPTNLSRFFPSLPGYIYAAKEERIYINLFVSSSAQLHTSGTVFRIAQRSDYPWSGDIGITVDPESPARLRLFVRIPGWAREELLAGSLYRFATPSQETPAVFINDVPQKIQISEGWLIVDREWQPADTIRLVLPMPVRKVVCDPRVTGNRGKAALQRGPIVYCIEDKDSVVPLRDLKLGNPELYVPVWEPSVLGGIVRLRGQERSAIPYYSWANRGPAAMKVWIDE